MTKTMKKEKTSKTQAANGALAKGRKARRKQTAEVFTPHSLVDKMVSKLPGKVWHEGKTFCDPACGNGNFLLHILWRKIRKGHKPLEALKTIYGVDIKKDNIMECRLRLLKMVSIIERIEKDHIEAVFTNIVFVDQETYLKGALDYDFSFPEVSVEQEEVDRWTSVLNYVDDWMEALTWNQLAESHGNIDVAEHGDSCTEEGTV